MSLPHDVTPTVSFELSEIIEALVNDPDIEEAVTLGFLRQRIARREQGRQEETDRMHFGSQDTVLGEIDALIEQHGEDAPGIEFVVAKASEPLSRVIEAMMSDANTTQRPTLGIVREAMNRGLLARLAGDGTIEPDEDDRLIGEVEALIDQFGKHAIAEHFIRYE